MKHECVIIRILSSHTSSKIELEAPLSLPTKGIMKELAPKLILFYTPLSPDEYSRSVLKYENMSTVRTRVLAGQLLKHTRLLDFVRTFRASVSKLAETTKAPAIASRMSDGGGGGTFVLELKTDVIDDKGYLNVMYVDSTLRTGATSGDDRRRIVTVDWLRNSTDEHPISIASMKLFLSSTFPTISEASYIGDAAYATKDHVSKILSTNSFTREAFKVRVEFVRGHLDVEFINLVKDRYFSVV